MKYFQKAGMTMTKTTSYRMSVAPWDCFKGFEYALKVLKILHAYITTYTLPDFPLPDLQDLPDLPLQTKN